MDDLASAAAAIVRALAQLSPDTRVELANAFYLIADAEPDQLNALADQLAPAAADTAFVGTPIVLVRQADGTERRFGSIDSMLPGGLRQLSGPDRIRVTMLVRSGTQHDGGLFGLEPGTHVEILDTPAAVAELLGQGAPAAY